MHMDIQGLTDIQGHTDVDRYRSSHVHLESQPHAATMTQNPVTN
jgi:hypothetical protein